MGLRFRRGTRRAAPLRRRYVTVITDNAVRERNTSGTMFLPYLCEKVRLAGRDGLFRVLLIDYEEQTVELVPIDHIAPLLGSVPLTELRAVEQHVGLPQTDEPTVGILGVPECVGL